MYTFEKRIVDLLLSIVFLILSLPLWGFVALLVKLSDGGPIFYAQKRVGKNGVLFDLYKFRTMKHKVGGLFYTQENDPRITKVGRILRQLSLDELPQIFNVLKGEMSLVGPRPDVEIQQESYTKAQKEKRNSVLPGITGLAQATKRSLATFEERLQLDLDYIESHSLVNDFRIIYLTAKNLLSKNKN